MKTITTWEHDMTFSSNFEGHSISLNGATDADGNKIGFSPKAALLSGLAACSGIDVIDILQKMRVPVGKLEIVTDADQSDEHPKVFKDITIEYRIEVDPEHADKVNKAVNLSMDKYCGVAAMLRKNSAIVPKITLL